MDLEWLLFGLNGFLSFVILFRWYAKRFLQPAVVYIYDYIFLWDEDLGVEHFSPRRYKNKLVHLLKKSSILSLLFEFVLWVVVAEVLMLRSKFTWIKKQK